MPFVRKWKLIAMSIVPVMFLLDKIMSFVRKWMFIAMSIVPVLFFLD